MIERDPPGLLSRRTFPIDGGRWMLEEEWDISVPGCPMIKNPWNPPMMWTGTKFIRRLEMTAEEHAAYETNKIPGAVA